MKQLRVKNFRSIEDSGMINIKPITVFLGKNSCGKSSFIRILPLLKQSLEKEKQEPLLWYGDYVDFGGFEDIIPKNMKKKEGEPFELEFTVNLLGSIDDNYFPRNFRSLLYSNFIDLKKSNKNILVAVRVGFNKKEISIVDLSYLDQKINISFKNGKIDSFFVNGVSLETHNYHLIYAGKELLPEIIFKGDGARNIRYFYDEVICQCKPIVDILYEKLGSKASLKTLEKIVGDVLFIQTKEELLTKLKECKKNEKIRNYFCMADLDDPLVEEINNRMQMVLTPYIIYKINQELNDFFDNLYYIKPIRANANRYYRIQGISVKKVDPDGSNLPMILYNLSAERQKEFSSWCKEQLGISFSVKETGGHISLMVNTGAEYEINIADSGYGYSQVLPIILQIWLLIEKTKKPVPNRYSTNYTIIIEQPELHLHPAFQAKLAEIFVSFIASIKQTNSNVNIIIETHSDVIVNRLGTLVVERKIDNEDMNIVLVEKREKISTFKQVRYEDNGLIDKWPIGFMSSEA